MDLKAALKDPLWVKHKLGFRYIMDRSTGWKIAYYPIFQDGKTGEFYEEPRALVEIGIPGGGTDFREVPLRYLKPTNYLKK